jgi:hypothetical protein
MEINSGNETVDSTIALPHPETKVLGAPKTTGKDSCWFLAGIPLVFHNYRSVYQTSQK